MSLKINSIGFMQDDGEIKIAGKVTAAGKINLEPLKGDGFIFKQSDLDLAGKVIKALERAHTTAIVLHNRLDSISEEVIIAKGKLVKIRQES